MRLVRFAIPLLLIFAGCQKNNPEAILSAVYTASFTLNSTNCEPDYGFRPLFSTETLNPEFSPSTDSHLVELELVVELCSSIFPSNLPQTIPAVIYKNGEVYLTVDLIRTLENQRRYVYHFNHYNF